MEMVVDKYKALVAPNCKLDEVTVSKICDKISKGNYISVACEAAGISRQRYYDWNQRAEQGEEPFIAFVTEVKRAEAEAETMRISKITEAGEKSWQANAWVSERKNPERWGQTQRIHQVHEVSPEVKALLSSRWELEQQLRTVEGEWKEIDAVQKQDEG